ncbi:hypothetical protein [Niabella digestorum]|uniref:Uncharacterized protein n=1 Tax=Niabella digestorum TaxID=3117701 RepID=A0ABU7RJX4_9BACT
MEFTFLISIILLIAYAVLGLFDGVFLHLYKYRLYEHKESKFEHLTHTIRAVLFSGILYSLFIGIENNQLFFIGIALIVLDIITLIVDAYVEKDSRKFMGGLPRWEYIIHLLVNGFHFASIAVFLVIKINLTDNGITLQNSFQQYSNFHIFRTIALNLLPGAILIGLLHILVYIPKFNFYFKKVQFKCC